MSSADLKERVSFDPPAPGSVDGFGGYADAFGDGIETRAHFTFLRTGESVMQSRLAGRVVLAVKIRANASTLQIDGGYRMRDLRRGKFYNVKGVERSQDRRWLEILVEGGDLG
jgi:hypothetical protein